MRSRPPHYIRQLANEKKQNPGRKKIWSSIAATVTKRRYSSPFCYFATPDCLYKWRGVGGVSMNRWGVVARRSIRCPKHNQVKREANAAQEVQVP